jgi:hypothetical protein
MLRQLLHCQRLAKSVGSPRGGSDDPDSRRVPTRRRPAVTLPLVMGVSPLSVLTTFNLPSSARAEPSRRQTRSSSPSPAPSCMHPACRRKPRSVASMPRDARRHLWLADCASKRHGSGLALHCGRSRHCRFFGRSRRYVSQRKLCARRAGNQPVHGIDIALVIVF